MDRYCYKHLKLCFWVVRFVAEVMTDLYKWINPKNGKHSPMISKQTYDLIMRNEMVRLGVERPVARWLVHQHSNPESLGSIPSWGRVRGSLSVPLSQLLCRLVSA